MKTLIDIIDEFVKKECIPPRRRVHLSICDKMFLNIKNDAISFLKPGSYIHYRIIPSQLEGVDEMVSGGIYKDTVFFVSTCNNSAIIDKLIVRKFQDLMEFYSSKFVNNTSVLARKMYLSIIEGVAVPIKGFSNALMYAAWLTVDNMYDTDIYDHNGNLIRSLHYPNTPLNNIIEYVDRCFVNTHLNRILNLNTYECIDNVTMSECYINNLIRENIELNEILKQLTNNTKFNVALSSLKIDDFGNLIRYIDTNTGFEIRNKISYYKSIPVENITTVGGRHKSTHAAHILAKDNPGMCVYVATAVYGEPIYIVYYSANTCTFVYINLHYDK